MQTAGTARLAGTRVLANHPRLPSRLGARGPAPALLQLRGARWEPTPQPGRTLAPSHATQSPHAAAVAAETSPQRPTANQPVSNGPPTPPGQAYSPPIFSLLKQHRVEFLGTATCTLSLLRILLLAAGNNPCPELAQQEQHPLQNQGCAGIHQQQRCPEEEPRSLSPPSHLPFSLLTFLAPLLKQLNSLDFFFFSLLPPSPVWFSL